MQLTISGHHVEITDGIRESVDHKYAKVRSHYPDLEAISLIMTVEKNEQRVEANTHYLGAPVSVHAADDDLYIAIAESAKKLEAALSHRKGVIKAHKHGHATR